MVQNGGHSPLSIKIRWRMAAMELNRVNSAAESPILLNCGLRVQLLVFRSGLAIEIATGSKNKPPVATILD